MSDLHSMVQAIRKQHPVNCGCNDCLWLDAREQSYAERFYDPRERSFEQVMEDETGKPAFGPL